MSFDVSQSAGCAEDFDNGLDDDLDGFTDCLDDDYRTEPLQGDLDGDGSFAEPVWERIAMTTILLFMVEHQRMVVMARIMVTVSITTAMDRSMKTP